MPSIDRKSVLGPVLVLGSIWGLAEAALGMYLRQCASTVSGSLMTGAALFFLAAGWAVSPRLLTIAGMVAMASFFKLFDALLLGLPILHGAVANPIFAFITEGAAFLLIVLVFRRDLLGRLGGQSLAGGLAALAAVNVFPLVGFATGIAACKVPGPGIPLALYYGPIAIALAALTVPAGLAVGARLSALEGRLAGAGSRVLRWASPATLALSLAALALLRLI